MVYPLSIFLANYAAQPVKSYLTTVLLVDDQPIVAEAVRQMLSEQNDIILHYCSDSKQAVEMASRLKPTVILQDLVMPELDGLSLIKLYKAKTETAEIPVIVLSTKEEPSTKAEAFAIGANDYVVKLPDQLELIARIRHHSKGYIRLLERNEAYRKLEENQKILNAELSEAAAYVRFLLPSSLEGSIQADWRFIPSAQLGGDSFGYYWLDDQHFVIYLLDVCGHGVGAALLSVSVANLIRLQNLQADFTDPSSVLMSLNQTFQMERHNNMFFTIWYGVYNKATRELVYASGGHPYALLITGDTPDDAQVIQLQTPSVVIGVLPQVEFRNASCKIKDYNRLYIFSDGIYEVSDASGKMLILQEFTTLLAQISFQEKSEAVLDRIINFVQEEWQHNKSFDDDVSIIQFIFKD